MSQTSIKKNFAYKSILTISTYIMGFIVFPYISRVFGVDRLGLVNFAENTINYFLLFASMGIAVLGVREIAAVKDDYNARNRVFSNVLGVNLLFTLATLIIYFVLIALVPKLNQSSELFYIGSAKILFTTFLIEWFYTGIENFKYITIRSIIIKLLYVLLVFLLVREKEDYIIYFALTIGTVVLNACVNMLYARRYIRIVPSELFNLKYLKNNVTLGIYSIMTSMYLTFNVMYLGFVTNNTQVGYYTTAFKLYAVILGFFSAFTHVMLPRMSALLAEDNKERFQELANRSFSTMVLFCIPLILCSIVAAPQIIYVLSGAGYEGAILPMRIIMPAILCVGIAQVLAVQILMPMKKDKVLLNTSIFVSIMSVVLNFIIIDKLQSVGSAIVMLSAEIVATLLYVRYVILKLKYRFSWYYILCSIFLSMPSACCCYIITDKISNPYVSLPISMAVSVAIWMLLLMLFGKRLNVKLK